jgi:pSer/pThr/pTyr-binding forkhead associated (FHA) protein
MYLEVTIADKEPVNYKLTRPEVLLGALPYCDIKLEVSTISKKHLMLSDEGEDWFVIDLDSTNGSFLNDQRINPNEKVRFTVGSIVRLGIHVKLKLVEQPTAGILVDLSASRHEQARAQVDKTQSISLQDLKSTEQKVFEHKKRVIRKTVLYKKKAGLREKQYLLKSVLIALSILFISFYLHKLIIPKGHELTDSIKTEIHRHSEQNHPINQVTE